MICLKLVNDKKAFPYNKRGEYYEQDHIGLEIGRVLQSLRYDNYYTADDLLEQAKKRLIKEKKVLAIK